MEEQTKIIKSDNRPDPVYANGVTINCSVFEASIEFIRETNNAADKLVTRENVADIRMSPQLAKALAMILTDQVNKYEKEFGVMASPIAQQGDANV